MPALRLAGHKWRVSSDFVPIFACVSLVFHVIWCVFIIVWPFGITKVHKCNNTKPGRQFLASVWLFFILYVTSAVQEILIIIIGLRGTPKLDRDVAADCKPFLAVALAARLLLPTQARHWRPGNERQ